MATDMALKTYNCPNCGCVMQLPQFDGTAEVHCVACRVPITLTEKAGKTIASTAPVAGRE